MKLLTQLNPGGGSFTAGVSDNDLVYTSPDVSRYTNFQIETNAAADVEVSVDRGASWIVTAIALEDPHVAASATRVLVTAANKTFRFAPGLRFTNFRIRQAGATAVNAFKVLCTRDA